MPSPQEPTLLTGLACTPRSHFFLSLNMLCCFRKTLGTLGAVCGLDRSGVLFCVPPQPADYWIFMCFYLRYERFLGTLTTACLGKQPEVPAAPSLVGDEWHVTCACVDSVCFGCIWMNSYQVYSSVARLFTHMRCAQITACRGMVLFHMELWIHHNQTPPPPLVIFFYLVGITH